MSKARELAELGAVYDSGALSNRNMIINGAMQVAQRGTSSTGLGASSGYFTVDRFAHNFSSTSGRLTSTQESITDLPGFDKALKIACTTADTSLGASEYFTIAQSLEGSDVQRLKKGTSSAEKVTVSFYVKGNAAATYVFELQDQSSREISQQFSVTTSWNRVVLTFIADTSGAITNTNTYGLGFSFWLAGGSNFNSGNSSDLNTTWDAVGGTAGSRAAGISNFFDSTSRTLFITGLQIEVGSEATPFEHRSFGDEHLRCQRYFTKSYAYGTAIGATTSHGSIQTTFEENNQGAGYRENYGFKFPVQMRATPTIVIYDSAGTSGKCNYYVGTSSSPARTLNVSSTNATCFGGYSDRATTIGGWAAQYTADAEL